MTEYKITWHPRGPQKTEIQSDTLFGHICWAIRYLLSERILTEFLNELQSSSIFLISSAFPEGYLPFPGSLPMDEKTVADIKMLPGVNSEKTGQNILKKLKKSAWIDEHWWHAHSKSYSMIELIRECWNLKDNSNPENFFHGQTLLKDDVLNANHKTITHSSIDRRTGTVRKGLLYDEDVLFYPETAQLQSFVQTDYFSFDQISKIFGFIEVNGFGKDKNIGKGQFRITVTEHNRNEPENTNAWLMLSNCVPNDDDPVNAFYDGFTKYVKTG